MNAKSNVVTIKLKFSYQSRRGYRAPGNIQSRQDSRTTNFNSKSKILNQSLCVLDTQVRNHVFGHGVEVVIGFPVPVFASVGVEFIDNFIEL
jgi:hypothetical protein